MAQLDTGEPVWDLEFDERGGLVDPGAAETFLSLSGGPDVTDVFVFSHGWGASRASAEQLYQGMFPLIRAAAAAKPQLGPLAFVRVFWPSLGFPPTDATPPASTGATQADAGPLTTAK